MKRKYATLVWILIGAIALCLTASPTWAGDYPSKRIQVIVPYGAGGGNDVIARIIVSYFEKELGQNMTVINKPGAKSEIGMAEIQEGQPDGYHLGFTSYMSSAILSAYKKTRYDLDKMVYIASFTADPTALSIKKDSPFNTLDGLIKYAKKNPGRLTVGVAGESHIYSIVQLEQAAGIKVSSVTYKSGSAAMNAMLGGHVDAVFVALQWNLTAAPQGCPILAVASDERMSAHPEIPTFHELGYDVECVITRELIAPKGIPDEAMQRLTEAGDKIAKIEELNEKLTKADVVFKYRNAATLEQYFKKTAAKVNKLVAGNKDAFLR